MFDFCSLDVNKVNVLSQRENIFNYDFSLQYSLVRFIFHIVSIFKHAWLINNEIYSFYSHLSTDFVKFRRTYNLNRLHVHEIIGCQSIMYTRINNEGTKGINNQ